MTAIEAGLISVLGDGHTAGLAHALALVGRHQPQPRPERGAWAGSVDSARGMLILRFDLRRPDLTHN
jgi:hypothetical protein